MTWYLILITFSQVYLPEYGSVLVQYCHYKTHKEQKWEDRKVYAVPPDFICPRTFSEA